MTTEQTATETPVTPPVEPAPVEEPSKEPAELRAALKREQEQGDIMRQELMGLRLNAIGLTVDAGLGKAIAKEYDGALDLDAVTAYALSEYQHEFIDGNDPPAVLTTERLEAINQVSDPVTPPEPTDQAAEATQKVLADDATIQDAEASMNAKLAQYITEHVPQ